MQLQKRTVHDIRMTTLPRSIRRERALENVSEPHCHGADPRSQTQGPGTQSQGPERGFTRVQSDLGHHSEMGTDRVAVSMVSCHSAP